MAEGAVIDLSGVDSTPLDVNDDVFDVKTELISVAARWRDVGIALRLKSYTLDSIETKWNNDPCRCLEMMVTEWLKRNYNVEKFGEPTWRKLVEAVDSPAGGANTALARDIASRHKAGGKLTLEAAPSTSPLTPSRSVDARSPRFFPSGRGLPSQPPTNQLEGAQAQPLSLEEEIKQFEEKFEDLVDCVLRAFERGGVSLQRVLECLRQLPVSRKHQGGEFLQSHTALLCQASSIDELFFILSLYWDFLNPNLLTHLANKIGDKQAMRSVEEYLKDLRKFRMRTKIVDLIDKWSRSCLRDTLKLVIVIGDIWRERSVEQLEELRTEFLRMCYLEDYAMLLKGIKPNVNAMFLLPKSAHIELQNLQKFLQEHQVEIRILPPPPGVGGLLSQPSSQPSSQPPTNQLKGAQTQQLSLQLRQTVRDRVLATRDFLRAIYKSLEEKIFRTQKKKLTRRTQVLTQRPPFPLFPEEGDDKKLEEKIFRTQKKELTQVLTQRSPLPTTPRRRE